MLAQYCARWLMRSVFLSRSKVSLYWPFKRLFANQELIVASNNKPQSKEIQRTKSLVHESFRQSLSIEGRKHRFHLFRREDMVGKNGGARGCDRRRITRDRASEANARAHQQRRCKPAGQAWIHVFRRNGQRRRTEAKRSGSEAVNRTVTCPDYRAREQVTQKKRETKRNRSLNDTK